MTNLASNSSTPRWPIFVLSLSDDVERRTAISAQFNVLGLSFSFFDAIDGRQGIAPELERFIDRPGTKELHGYGMSDGEYACALSHQFAYKKILDLNLPGAIILEDDAILTHRFKEFYENRSYETAPLIQLFFFDAMIWRGRGINAQGIKLERLSDNAWMAVGYSISAKSAAHMREASLPLRARADWPCNTTKLVGHYITIPRVILHPTHTLEQSRIQSTAPLIIPDNFDFSAGYAKGWRRLYSLGSWGRLIKRLFTRRLRVEFQPTSEEILSIVISPD